MPSIDIFKGKGASSMGYDMSPIAADFYNLGGSAGGGNLGSANSANTPYGSGFSWALSNQFSIMGLGANKVTLFHGFWVKLPSLPGTNQRIIAFYDATAANYQANLRVYSDGHFAFCSGSSSTVIGATSATGLISANVWCHIQYKIVIDASAGVVQLIVNDDGTHTKAINSSGLVTKQTANTWVSGIEFNSVVTTGNTYFDDNYFLDGSASSPLNDFLGIVQVVGDKPSANSAVGGRNAWTPTNPQNSNYLNVGNAPVNTAQYNADQTPGDYDMFRFPPLSNAGSVFFLNEWYRCGLDAGGTRTVEADCYSGGTDATGSSFTPAAIATPTFSNEPFLVDPNTSSAWTVSGAQSAELGLKVVT